MNDAPAVSVVALNMELPEYFALDSDDGSDVGFGDNLEAITGNEVFSCSHGDDGCKRKKKEEEVADSGNDRAWHGVELCTRKESGGGVKPQLGWCEVAAWGV